MATTKHKWGHNSRITPVSQLYDPPAFDTPQKMRRAWQVYIKQSRIKTVIHSLVIKKKRYIQQRPQSANIFTLAHDAPTPTPSLTHPSPQSPGWPVPNTLSDGAEEQLSWQKAVYTRGANQRRPTPRHPPTARPPENPPWP